MQTFKKYFLLIVVILLIYSLNRSWNTFPPLAKFLDPYHGCWQNTKPETDRKVTYNFEGLQSSVEVRFDERMVPHIFAQHSVDAIFVQGYIHAAYRLWQMDMTTCLASGRLSEVAGKNTLRIDREMRRKGMVFGAENSLKTMENDSVTKSTLDAYRDGVNTLISSLRYSTYPLEYKLMDFKPEPWTNLKTALMMKFMADKLSGETEDFELTLAKKLFSNDFNLIYPEHLDEEYPVVGNDHFNFQSTTKLKQNKDSITNCELQITNLRTPFPKPRTPNSDSRSTQDIGSNNWAIDGHHTQSGKPILCNDPHLPLNLPAIWYENQIVSPDLNVYGVSLPGAPQVVIGFNDSIAWGFTNGYRDVKDFYSVQFKDASKKEIFLQGKYIPTEIKIEIFHVKGHADFKDTVAYTPLGIVMYDASFPKKGFEQQNFALQWMAHKGTDELKALILLNQSKNYLQYVDAIKHFQCPHQNIVFASTSGDIAMWSQGLFINKSNQQGRFLQDGINSLSLWGDTINEAENPHEINPSRGFVMSANQVNTDAQYPFYYNGIFHEERAKRLSYLLSQPTKFTVQDMMLMQNDTYWQNASEILPIFLNELGLLKTNQSTSEKISALTQWDFKTAAESSTPILYDVWYKQFIHDAFDDEFAGNAELIDYPKERVVLQLLKQTQLFDMFDNKLTNMVETKSHIILKSFQEMCAIVDTMKIKKWYEYKHTTAEHLSKIPAFGVPNIQIGGGQGIVNAASSHNGPSWRMIVHMTTPIEAYGIYPGGESGNVGSKYYIDMMDDWAKGKYYKLHFAHSPNDIQ